VIADIVSTLTIAAALGGGVRWLRIAQREHYIAGSVTRFALRWWGSRPENMALGALMVLGACAAWAGWWGGTAVAGALSLTAPLGLSYRGRDAKLEWTRGQRPKVSNPGLKWTRRLGTLAALLALFIILCGMLGAIFGALLGVSAVIACCASAFVDAALYATAPLERRLRDGYIRDAVLRLAEVSPRVVAITGSYGKTSTKEYVGHLLSARYATHTSPKSYNNAAGLSSTVNNDLIPGHQVFVAEMGTYGPGEIQALCQWLKPEISVITAIGPVHLERMGSIDNIARAKAEILENARIGVLNIDSPQIASIAAEYKKRGGHLIQCSTKNPTADVYVSTENSKMDITVQGNSVGVFDLPGKYPGNVACAVGVAFAMGISIAEIASILPKLKNPAHRQDVLSAPSGITMIDDTYNSNPEGSAGALAILQQSGGRQRKVVVTPGMVELGAEQFAANETFARRAAQVATDVIIVGRTNRRALLRGVANGPAHVIECATRKKAVSWVSSHLTSGDAVLYENDLPDHYP
jgi:UDP-N-acetylmuramoyl-tripeptide--D-alanyl-D-alanine ligase